MEFKREDVNRFVAVEISIDELSLLRELLRFETVLQLSLEIKSISDITTRVNSSMKLFDTYRDQDDHLANLVDAMKKGPASGLAPTGALIKNMIVIPKNICKLYKMLCTETVAHGMPSYLGPEFAKFSPNLIINLDVALLKDYSYDEIKDKRPNELFRTYTKPHLPEPEVEEIEGGLKVNILGVKGLA